MKRAPTCALSLHNIVQGHMVVLLSVSDVLGPIATCREAVESCSTAAVTAARRGAGQQR